MAELELLKATFRLESEDVDRYGVFADAESGHVFRVADLWWDGAVWLFIPRTASGIGTPDGTGMPAETIDVDPHGRLHLNEVSNENAETRHERSPGVNDAMDQAMLVARTNHRDETRELAELMARGKARIHWRSYRLWLAGCTGCVDRHGDLQHDADTCPIHEL